jgi:uncharacterized protein (UPF0264 family)
MVEMCHYDLIAGRVQNIQQAQAVRSAGYASQYRLGRVEPALIPQECFEHQASISIT